MVPKILFEFTNAKENHGKPYRKFPHINSDIIINVGNISNLRITLLNNLIKQNINPKYNEQ